MLAPLGREPWTPRYEEGVGLGSCSRSVPHLSRPEAELGIQAHLQAEGFPKQVLLTQGVQAPAKPLSFCGRPASLRERCLKADKAPLFAPTPMGASRERNSRSPLSQGTHSLGGMPAPTHRWLLGPGGSACCPCPVPSQAVGTPALQTSKGLGVGPVTMGRGQGLGRRGGPGRTQS